MKLSSSFFKIINLATSLIAGLSYMTLAQSDLSLEAEMAILSGTANIVHCNSASEGTLASGKNSLLLYDSPIIDKITIKADNVVRQPSNFYISSSAGYDNNDGASPARAWQSISKVNELELVPGDSLFFKAGDTLQGALSIINEGGIAGQSVVIGSYGSGPKPVIDGDGYLSSLHIQNSGHVHIGGLELMNNGGPAKPGEPTKLRYGLFIENTYSDGTVFEHFRIKNLTFKNIFPTEMITDNDQTGVHAYGFNTSGSWGDTINPTRFRDLIIENCFFTRTGRHALRVVATDNLIIKNNLFEHVGGAGMVIGANSSNILVERNTTNYTGSSIDSRMAGRGSGFWAFRTKNLTVQHNKFMHARGIKDSFGMHIDIGNRNVVYQYNYSEDNEGGFAEILGANVNVGYRYNLSIGDGWRSRGSQSGRIFWVGGWSGNPNNPIGSDSVFIYNNSVYVRDSIAPRIWIEAVTKRTRIYNNIIYVSDTFGDVFIKNSSNLNDFDYNVWYGSISTTDTDGETYRGIHATTYDPLFLTRNIAATTDFVLQAQSPVLNSGKIMFNPLVNSPHSYYDNHGGRDYFGNLVSNTLQPNIGAYNGPGDVVNSIDEPDPFLDLFPNPVQEGQPIELEIPPHLNVKILSVQILDMTGKIVFEQSFRDQHKIRLKTADIPRGSYLIHIQTDNYEITRQVLVR